MERKEILNPSSCKVGDHVKDLESRVAVNELLLKMSCIGKFMSFAKTGAPLEHTKKNLIW